MTEAKTETERTGTCRTCGQVVPWDGEGILGSHSPDGEKLRWRRTAGAPGSTRRGKGVIANLCPGSFDPPTEA